ncbi:MAG: hypothetical protein LCI03_01225 [Actinobacteria bacterium]|jgi:hypothetical protein|nr:hypothetical protein [Actinomycetota bacterium]
MTRRTQPCHPGSGSLAVTDPVTALTELHPAPSLTARSTDLETDMHYIPEQMARSHLASRQAEAELSRRRRAARAARRAEAAERRARLAREAAVLAQHQAQHAFSR